VSVFTYPARVYWEDTDGGAIVYYANYLRYLERARTEWLRTFGYSQQALAQDPGILFTVVSLQVEYRAPARLDDLLSISCEPRPDKLASMHFIQRIHRVVEDTPAQLLVDANVRVACLDARTLRPKRWPSFLVEDLVES
jgi:acyl-CoA thioester hydrolase